MEEKRIFKLNFKGKELIVEVGELAKKANAACLVRYEDTTILSACVMSKNASSADFFPLTINYQEKFYSVGKIPGGFIKREGRPTEQAVLAARLIDRPIRPLFADGFRNEVQVISTVLSVEAFIYGKTEKAERTITVYSDDEAEYNLALCLYDCLTKITGYTPAWGLLTGVRPSKLMNRLIEEKGEDNAKTYFKNKLLVSEGKTQLAFEVAQAQKQIFNNNRADSFSLYVSIPFCPSRCSYCSFVSHSVEQAKKLIPDYEAIENLVRTTGAAFCLSGAGPTLLCITQDEKLDEKLAKKLDSITTANWQMLPLHVEFQGAHVISAE